MAYRLKDNRSGWAGLVRCVTLDRTGPSDRGWPQSGPEIEAIGEPVAEVLSWSGRWMDGTGRTGRAGLEK